MTEAEMRYIDQDLWNFIQKFCELGDYDSTREAQKELAERLENIPFGMILNQPIKEKNDEEDQLLKI